MSFKAVTAEIGVAANAALPLMAIATARGTNLRITNTPPSANAASLHSYFHNHQRSWRIDQGEMMVKMLSVSLIVGVRVFVRIVGDFLFDEGALHSAVVVNSHAGVNLRHKTH